MSDDPTMTRAGVTAAEKVRTTLLLLSETASTTERIQGLRALKLRLADIALACDVSDETLRNWCNRKEPNARGRRLLDRLRYSASLVLAEEGDVGRAGAWLTSANESLAGQSPIEVFSQRHRDVMRLASAHAFALHDARHDPPPATVIKVVPTSEGPTQAGRDSRRRPASLSPAQARIARLLQDGWDVREIAEALQLSKAEISRELNRIQKAFGLTEVDAIRGLASDALSQAVAEAAAERDR